MKILCSIVKIFFWKWISSPSFTLLESTFILLDFPTRKHLNLFCLLSETVERWLNDRHNFFYQQLTVTSRSFFLNMPSVISKIATSSLSNELSIVRFWSKSISKTGGDTFGIFCAMQIFHYFVRLNKTLKTFLCFEWNMNPSCYLSCSEVVASR